MLDQLSKPDFQCNHPPGTHKKIAGGRSASGWASEEEAAYPNRLCVRLAMAFTSARTGQAEPLQMRGWAQVPKLLLPEIQSKTSDAPLDGQFVSPSTDADVNLEAAAPSPDENRGPRRRILEGSPIAFGGFGPVNQCR